MTEPASSDLRSAVTVTDGTSAQPECDCEVCQRIMSAPDPRIEDNMTDQREVTQDAAAQAAAEVPEQGPQDSQVSAQAAEQDQAHIPATPQEPGPPEPVVDARAVELARRRLLTAAGGLEGQADRLNHVNSKPDHIKGE